MVDVKFTPLWIELTVMQSLTDFLKSTLNIFSGQVTSSISFPRSCLFGASVFVPEHNRSYTEQDGVDNQIHLSM